ncbi:MAG: Fic family protein [Desulfovibrio sp.]|nr:Fic family protein [Desulfovibrio sp.]
MSTYQNDVLYASKEIWDMAIGLQDVDNLTVSDKVKKLAKENAEKKCDFATIEKFLSEQDDTYYIRDREANVVACRIAKLLTCDNFSLSIDFLKSIHKKLFKDIYDSAGEIRSYNINKEEPVLNNRTVEYADFRKIKSLLKFDFNTEIENKNIFEKNVVRKICSFTKNIWSTHPFSEGNTRTVAVFIIKYIKSLGIDFDTSCFAEHSRYFRNALVRTSFSDYTHGFPENTKFLKKFFENMILGNKNKLVNIDLVYFELFPYIQKYNKKFDNLYTNLIREFLSLYTSENRCEDNNTVLCIDRDHKLVITKMEYVESDQTVLVKASDNFVIIRDRIPLIIENYFNNWL